VPEAAAADGPAAGRLLAGLATLARVRGLGKITLILTPDNLLTRAAVLAGAEQHYRPAKAGFSPSLIGRPTFHPATGFASRGVKDRTSSTAIRWLPARSGLS
jgi:hypothetical protein